MPLQTILLEEKVYDLERSRSWGSEFSDDAYNYSHSLALICPKCLKQWCVMAFQGDEHIHPQGAFCAEHGDGRLLLEYGPIDLPLLRSLPEELLRRELLLTLDRLEAENGLS